MTCRALTLAVVLGAATSARAGGLAIVGTELRDNGDHDGYADTNETVELWLTVKNTTTQTLTSVTAHLAIASGNAVCIADRDALVGDLPVGATLRAAEPLVFHVGAGQDRTALGKSPFDALSANFNVSFTASPSAPKAVPDRLVFDLDLDVAGTGPATTVIEGFESGFGIFQVQNLDFGLHVNPETGANGYRCQYHAPYCDHASCSFDECYIGGSAAAANATWWSIDGRAYTGNQSLYFGQALSPGPGYTTPTGALEAAATGTPIPLTMESAPALTLKHQVSFVDERLISNIPPGTPDTALDRGVVAVQLADNSGAPVGPWLKIDPVINAYDNVGIAYFVNCSFDPIDDGNREDDLYPPFTAADGLNRRGPSSTCAEERVFSFIGSTAGPFDPAAVGRADGPGLAGNVGPGTWIETRFDLSRFRGRSVRLRFLATTTAIDVGVNTWADFGIPGADGGDDGWWIDDVQISGASATAGTVTNDTHDNSGLTVDADLDGADDACEDNCVGVANADQADLDLDSVGDVCDPCTDSDGDGWGNPGFPATTCALDNCPLLANASQSDVDLDTTGDVCDNCPLASNPGQENTDGDPVGDVCDCGPFNAHTYPGAIEWNDGQDNQCTGEPGFGEVDELSGTIYFSSKSTLAWPAQPGGQFYRIGRTAERTSSNPGAFCNTGATGLLTRSTVNPSLPGRIQFYLIQPLTPNLGSPGVSSSGVPRSVVSCSE